jgi:hypothetical protein
VLYPPGFVPPLADVAHHWHRMFATSDSKAVSTAFPQAILGIRHGEDFNMQPATPLKKLNFVRKTEQVLPSSGTVAQLAIAVYEEED